MKKTYKILGSFGFIVDLEPRSHDVIFNVLRIDSTELDYTVRETSEYANGNVKWDGCYNFSCSADHFCDAAQITKHCFLIQWLYSKCAEILIGQDESFAEYFDAWPSVEDLSSGGHDDHGREVE